MSGAAPAAAAEAPPAGRRPRLGPRLRACLDLCPTEGPVLDVGSAHGLLARALRARDAALVVYASESKPGPAAELRRLAGGDPGLRILEGAGLGPACGRGCRGAVIAGLGGHTIGAILQADAELAAQLAWLCLQPAQGVGWLLAALPAWGYRLRAAARPVERGRTYTALLVAPPCA